VQNDEAYRKQVLKTFFKNGILLKFPVQNRKKDVVLQKIASRLVPEKMYTDEELLFLLKKFHADGEKLMAEMLASRFVKTNKEGLHQLV
jgi:hypothetical protein